MINEQDYLSGLLQQLQQAEAADVEQLLLDAAAAHPTDARPLLLLAAQYAHTQDIDRAEASYIAALQRAPDFAIARFQLGLLQFSSARPAAALATFAPLEQLGNSHPLRLFKNAFECLAQDRLQDARAWLQKGIVNNTDNAPLNQDMQKMIRQIDALQSSSRNDNDNAKNSIPNAEPGTQAEQTSATSATEVEEHFLVSAYRNLH